MKKRVFGKKLSRSKSARRALFRGLIRALVAYGSIKTTKVKAKAVQGEIDRMVSLAKNGSLAARRRVYAKLGNDRKTTDLLFSKVATAFSARKSGFTRIIPLPSRRGDSAEMARLEWVEEVVISDKKKSKVKKGRTSSSGRTGKTGRKSIASRTSKIGRVVRARSKDKKVAESKKKK
jgi:large subunit ribosomal protein L17